LKNILCWISPDKWLVFREQITYKLSAIAATALFTGLAVFATYYRFFFHSGDYASFPYLEFWCTIAMIGGGVVRSMLSSCDISVHLFCMLSLGILSLCQSVFENRQ
jgi:hypothetical protein